MRHAIITAVAAILSSGAASAEDVRVYNGGRYVRVVAVPDPAQIEPLQTVVSVSFPRREIATVGDAAKYLLRRTGYAMPAVDAEAFPEHAKAASFPLPEIHRRFDGVTIASALEALAGAAYRPVIDDVERTVIFELKENADRHDKRRKRGI